MTMRDIFTPEFTEAPYWWDEAPRPIGDAPSLPDRLDVAIVGSGYTGLSAALTLSRAGRRVGVFESHEPGYGASTRNTGSLGRTFRQPFSKLMKEQGLERAHEVWHEVYESFDYAVDLMQREEISCDLTMSGRFTGAVTPNHYNRMVGEIEARQKHLGSKEFMVPEAEQGREIGSDFYHGGVVAPDTVAIHPGRYQLGLLEKVNDAGAEIIPHTTVLRIRRDGNEFELKTSRGGCRAAEVLVATNGYTGPGTPGLRRRVVPFPSFILATEQLPDDIVKKVMPQGRVFTDSNMDLFFLRPSPDNSRFLFGGYTGTTGKSIRKVATLLHRAMATRFPILSNTRVTHAWTGNCAATFDLYPHIGKLDGVHYAMGYCFAGIAMGTYLGHKSALRILGDKNARTAFDELEPPTRIYHFGRPWFMPLARSYFKWSDWRRR
jgi:glycine/D-amino acid oxidase-like deaminating enzyme